MTHYYISILTHNIDSFYTLLGLNFKESKFQPLKGYNVYFTTSSRKEYRRMLENLGILRLPDIEGSSGVADDDYLSYLSGEVGDPRD